MRANARRWSARVRNVVAIDPSACGFHPREPLVSQQHARAIDGGRTRGRRGGRSSPTEAPAIRVQRTPSKAWPSTRSAMPGRPGSERGLWIGLPVTVFWRLRHGKPAAPETTTPPPRSAIKDQPFRRWKGTASVSPRPELAWQATLGCSLRDVHRFVRTMDNTRTMRIWICRSGKALWGGGQSRIVSLATRSVSGPGVGIGITNDEG